MTFPKRSDSKIPLLPEGPVAYTVGKSGLLVPSGWVQAENMLGELQNTMNKEQDGMLQKLPAELVNSSASDDVSLLKVLESINTPTKNPNEKNRQVNRSSIRPPLPKKVVNQPVFAPPRKLINRKRPVELVDLNVRPDETLPKSKIPRLGVKRSLTYEDELDTIFAQFSAELYEIMRRQKSPKTAYNASRRVVQLHEQLQKL